MIEIEEQEIRNIDGPLTYARYVHCLFEGCVFDERDFSGASFQDCRFQDCLLNQVDLSSVRLKDVEFADSKLMGLDFTTCDMILFSPIFTNTKLYRCIFTDMNLKSGLSFQQCIVDECDFSDAKMRKSSFKECDLKGTTFHQTDLTESDFQEAVNFHIDVTQNKINKCKFSAPEVVSLLDVFDLEIV